MEALKEATQVCKCCGRELPLSEFNRSKLGRFQTCRECVAQNKRKAKERKRQDSALEKEIENVKKQRLQDFTPRELMKELKSRGYEFTAKYVEVHIIDSKTL